MGNKSSKKKETEKPVEKPPAAKKDSSSESDDDEGNVAQNRTGQLGDTKVKGWAFYQRNQVRIEFLATDRVEMDDFEEICENHIGKVSNWCEVPDKKNEVLVTFENAEAITTLQQKKERFENDYSVRIHMIETKSVYEPSDARESEASSSGSDDDDDNDDDRRWKVALEFTNVSQEAGKRGLKTFLEGRINGRISVEKTNKIYVVNFDKVQDAEKLYYDQREEPLLFSGKELSLRVVDGEILSRNPLGSSTRAITISGLSDDVTEGFIRSTFHGDLIESVHMQPDVHKCTITYSSPADTDRILRKKVDLERKHSVKIEMLKNEYRPNKLFENHAKDKIFFKGLPPHASRHSVEDYIKSGTGLGVKQIMFGKILRKALVQIRDQHPEEAYEKLYRLSRMTPIQGHMVTVDRIPQPKTLQVSFDSTADLTATDIGRFFEESESVTEQICGFIVRLPCPGDVAQYLADGVNVIKGNQVTLQPYYECLGFIPFGHNVVAPNIVKHADIPAPIDSLSKLRFIQKFPQHVKDIETSMEKVSTFVQWPKDDSSTTIMLTCILTGKERDFEKKLQDWDTTAENNFQGVLSNFVERRVNIDPQLRRKFAARWRKQSHNDGPDWVCEIRTEEELLVITGVHDAVIDQFKAAKRLHKELLQSHDQRDQSTKTTIRIERSLLRLKQFETELATTLKNDFKPVKWKTAGCGLQLSGPEEDVEECTIVIEGMMAQYEHETEQISDAKGNLLEEPTIMASLKKEFDRVDISVGYHWNTKNLSFHAQTKKEIYAAERTIETFIQEETLKPEAERAYILSTGKWDEFVRSLKLKHTGRFEISVTKLDKESALITIARLRSEKTDFVSNIQSFLNRFGIANTKVNLDTGAMLVIYEFHEKQLNNWTEELVVADGKEEGNIELDSDLPGFVLTGAQDLLPKIVKQLTELADNVKSKSHEVTEPGMPKYVIQNWTNLTAFSTRKKVIVTLGKGQQKRVAPVRKYRPRAPEVEDKDYMKIKCGKGFEIKVMIGDITKVHCDAIVNAANDKLQHTGGVAGAIVKAGGKVIQDECTKYIHSKGNLKKGETYVSCAGSLPCKYVIHTVGPQYIDGMHNEEADLFEAVYQAIEAASKRSCKSVSIPAVSSGIYGFPHDLCAQQIALAITNFVENASESKTALEEIIFIDINADFVAIISRIFRNIFPESATSCPRSEKKEDVETEVYRPAVRPKSAAGRPRTATGRPKTASRAGRAETSGPKLQLHIGDITDEQVDVIVNTTGKSLNLSQGAVSKHILQRAGNGIQTEVNTFAPHGIQFGDVATTSGGNLSCKQIYHTALKEYDRGSKDSIAVFKRTVRTCLENASRSSHGSIVFPALGAGGLGFPAWVVAQRFIETSEEFMRNQPLSSLQVIAVAVRAVDSQVIQAFQNEGIAPNAPKGRGLTSRYTAVLPAAKKGNWTTKEGVSVTIECGDITTYAVDVIVNACGKNMALNTGGLSSHILRKAGMGISDECAKKAPNGVNYGEIVKTSGGNLSCQEIYHCACQNFSSSSNQPLQNLKEALNRCLMEAHGSGYTTIALPAIGTGGFGFKAQVCAQATEDCIRNVSRMYPSTRMAITIVLRECDTANIQAFMQNVDTRTGGTSPRTTRETSPRASEHVFPNEGEEEKEEEDFSAPGPSKPKFFHDREPAPRPASTKELTFARETVKEVAFGSLRVQVVIGTTDKQKMTAVCFTAADGEATSIGRENCIVVNLGDRSKISISDAVTNILEQAESQKIPALAVPVLELETSKLGADVVSAAMAQRIYSYSEQPGFICLRVLRLVVMNQKLCSTYHRMLKEKSANLTIYLHSLDSNAMDQVINWIREAAIEHCLEQDLTKEYEKEISTLTDDNIQAIQALEDCFPIKIEIKKKPPLLKLHGLQDDIIKVKAKVQEYQKHWIEHERIRLEKHDKLEKEKLEKQLDDAYACTVKWSYLQGDKWMSYSNRNNRLIEIAYEKKHSRVYISDGQTKRFIDFSSNQEYDGRRKLHEVKRQKKEYEIPDTWSGDYDLTKVTLEDVSSTSSEYKDVEQTFLASIAKSNITDIRVIRIQNLFLWLRYVNKRNSMRQTGRTNAVEQKLWHGTGEDSLEFINNNGFDKSYFGKNGTAYGVGVYFACRASYSHHYAKANTQGERAMYFSRVLTGDFAQGSSDIKVPPVKSGTDTYDSVVDRMDPATRRMFVIFHQDQSYPEYLIKYKEN